MKFYWRITDIPELKGLEKEVVWNILHEATYTTKIFFSYLASFTTLSLLTLLATKYIGYISSFLVFVILTFFLLNLAIHYIRPRIARVIAKRREKTFGN